MDYFELPTPEFCDVSIAASAGRTTQVALKGLLYEIIHSRDEQHCQDGDNHGDGNESVEVLHVWPLIRQFRGAASNTQTSPASTAARVVWDGYLFVIAALIPSRMSPDTMRTN